MTVTIGIGTTTTSVSLDQVRALVDALDIQVKRDLKPIWDIDAQVILLEDPGTIPTGLNPIFITSEAFPGDVSGFHRIQGSVTFAFINAGRDWHNAASHECLEMLTDPSGCKLIPSTGMAVVDGKLQDLDTDVQYVLEVCDPLEDPSYSYEINGVRVSDFYTPDYFDRQARPGVRYSHRGALARPRDILDNGYLSWWDPVLKHFLQIRNFGALQQVDTGPWSPNPDVSARMYIDANTPTPRSRPDLFAKS